MNIVDKEKIKMKKQVCEDVLNDLLKKYSDVIAIGWTLHNNFFPWNIIVKGSVEWRGKHGFVPCVYIRDKQTNKPLSAMTVDKAYQYAFEGQQFLDVFRILADA